jgi:hypothetical protein
MEVFRDIITVKKLKMLIIGKLMKYLSSLLFLIVASYLAWPYLHIYWLDNAIANNNEVALTKLVDLESIRAIHKKTLENSIKNTFGTAENDMFSNMAKAFGGVAVDSLMDINWVKTRMQRGRQSLWQATTFAFFESPTRFTIRLGELSDNPVHVQMTLQDWSWRVTAIYG